MEEARAGLLQLVSAALPHEDADYYNMIITPLLEHHIRSQSVLRHTSVDRLTEVLGNVEGAEAIAAVLLNHTNLPAGLILAAPSCVSKAPASPSPNLCISLYAPVAQDLAVVAVN
jgi:hypothetical protein